MPGPAAGVRIRLASPNQCNVPRQRLTDSQSNVIACSYLLRTLARWCTAPENVHTDGEASDSGLDTLVVMPPDETRVRSISVVASESVWVQQLPMQSAGIWHPQDEEVEIIQSVLRGNVSVCPHCPLASVLKPRHTRLTRK